MGCSGFYKQHCNECSYTKVYNFLLGVYLRVDLLGHLFKCYPFFFFYHIFITQQAQEHNCRTKHSLIAIRASELYGLRALCLAPFRCNSETWAEKVTCGKIIQGSGRVGTRSQTLHFWGCMNESGLIFVKQLLVFTGGNAPLCSRNNHMPFQCGYSTLLFMRHLQGAGMLCHMFTFCVISNPDSNTSRQVMSSLLFRWERKLRGGE